MRNRSKLLLAGITAAVALGALVNAASANRIAMSEQNFRATWNNLKFSEPLFASVECHVTIEGSFHSKTLSKSPEQLIGYVTRGIVDEGHCTGGSARILTEQLPWHIRYESFTGTLPNIEGVRLRLVGAAFQIHALNLNCLFTSTASSPMKGTVNVNTSTHVAESLTPQETALIPRTSGDTGCPGSGKLANPTTNLTVQGGTSKITLTLVQ